MQFSFPLNGDCRSVAGARNIKFLIRSFQHSYIESSAVVDGATLVLEGDITADGKSPENPCTVPPAASPTGRNAAAAMQKANKAAISLKGFFITRTLGHPLTERREYLRIIWLFPAHIPSREIIFASVGRDDPGALLGILLFRSPRKRSACASRPFRGQVLTCLLLIPHFNISYLQTDDNIYRLEYR